MSSNKVSENYEKQKRILKALYETKIKAQNVRIKWCLLLETYRLFFTQVIKILIFGISKRNSTLAKEFVE